MSGVSIYVERRKRQETEHPHPKSNPLKLRQSNPGFLANFQKGLVELLGLDGTDNRPPASWYGREM